MSVDLLVSGHRQTAVKRDFLLFEVHHYCVFPLSSRSVQLCIEENCINCVCQWIAEMCQLAISQVAYSLKVASYQPKHVAACCWPCTHNVTGWTTLKLSPDVVRLVSGRQTIQGRNTGRDKSRLSLGSTQQSIRSVPRVERALSKCPG